MKQIKTKAIILKRINFSEADRIVTVLTSDQGKLSILAKGVRKSKSKLAGGLELFSVVDITYIDGRSELKTVISARLVNHFDNIVKDVDSTMVAYDMLKTVDKYTEHEPDNKYFELLQKSLESLDNSDLSRNITQLWFNVQVLMLHGSSVNLEKPLDSVKFSEDKQYSFSYDDMSFFSHASGDFKPNHIKFLQLSARASSPKKLTVIEQGDLLAESLVQVLKQAATMHKT